MTPEEPIQRYEVYAASGWEGCGSWTETERDPEGRWCEWDDVSPLIARIAALEGAIREHRDTVREFDPEAAQARDAEEKLWALLPD